MELAAIALLTAAQHQFDFCGCGTHYFSILGMVPLLTAVGIDAAIPKVACLNGEPALISHSSGQVWRGAPFVPPQTGALLVQLRGRRLQRWGLLLVHPTSVAL